MTTMDQKYKSATIELEKKVSNECPTYYARTICVACRKKMNFALCSMVNIDSLSAIDVDNDSCCCIGAGTSHPVQFNCQATCKSSRAKQPQTEADLSFIHCFFCVNTRGSLLFYYS